MRLFTGFTPACRTGGVGIHPAGGCTGHFQAAPPSGIAWVFNPWEATANQP
ncbi:MAG: hypothetical protein OXD45_02525 [Rhodobacteraceae bacterium]|nr:hypothetical protein [Paracoccaceae bacterium]